MAAGIFEAVIVHHCVVDFASCFTVKAAKLGVQPCVKRKDWMLDISLLAFAHTGNHSQSVLEAAQAAHHFSNGCLHCLVLAISIEDHDELQDDVAHVGAAIRLKRSGMAPAVGLKYALHPAASKLGLLQGCGKARQQLCIDWTL